MDYILHLLRLHPTLISSLVQAIVYTGCAYLFGRALWLIFTTSRHLRKVDPEVMTKMAMEKEKPEDPLSVLTAKTLVSAYKEHKGSPYPISFLKDAARQLSENLFEMNYINKITMLSNILPPMGFIGTVFGMIMIFMAKADPNSELNTSGLGAALFTTLVALTCFVIVEGLKMRLSNLSKIRIENGLNITINKPDT